MPQFSIMIQAFRDALENGLVATISNTESFGEYRKKLAQEYNIEQSDVERQLVFYRYRNGYKIRTFSEIDSYILKQKVEVCTTVVAAE